MQEKEYDLRVDEEEKWGDDELTAIDISAPFLLERADWTHYFNTKGYEGQYPFLLYRHEDAEVLHERILAEVNRTQMLSGRNKLQCDLFTRFVDNDGGVEGYVWLAISGTRSFAADLLDDLEWLLKSGTTTYLEHAYTSHGEVAQLSWSETNASESLADTSNNPLMASKLPPKSNLSHADRIISGTILPR